MAKKPTENKKTTGKKKATRTKAGGKKATTTAKAAKPKASTVKAKAATAAKPPGPRKLAIKSATGKKKSKSSVKSVLTTKKRPARSSLRQAPASPPIDNLAGTELPEPISEAKLRKVKSNLSRKDMADFRTLLMEKRAEIVGDVEQMEASRNRDNGGDLSHMPLHMADVGSDNYEQEFTLSLVESEGKLLGEINEALIRIEKKIYGVCVLSGVPISRARLEAKPWAKYSIKIARERERRGL